MIICIVEFYFERDESGKPGDPLLYIFYYIEAAFMRNLKGMIHKIFDYSNICIFIVECN